MSSRSYARWISASLPALDELEAAHKAVGGQGPGRRYATQQVNQAMTVSLSSRFQAYCRDLHTEATDYFVSGLAAQPGANQQALLDVVRARLLDNRKLDHGNPNLGNLGSDFGRLGFKFADKLKGTPASSRIEQALARLEELNLWRNAIAHQDFTGKAFAARFPSRTQIQLAEVRSMRGACRTLAKRMDTVLADELGLFLGTKPW